MKFLKPYTWVYLLAVAGYAWLAWNMIGLADPDTTVCMFKQATGFACPSCGTTRSLLSVLNGDFRSGLLINPLGFVGAAFLLFFPIAWTVSRILNRDLIAVFMQRMEKMLKQPIAAIPLIALVAINWIWNIAKGL